MKLLTAAEVAKATGVPRTRLYDLARQGIVPCVRLGRQLRFSELALQRWIEAGGRSLPGGWRRAESHESISDADRRSP